MKKLIFILLLFISILSYGQVKYYPGTNRFTNNLTVTGTGKFVLGNDTVTKICSDTLINPAFIRWYLATKINDTLADYYLSSVVEDTIKERIHDSLIGYMSINYFNGQNIFVGPHSGDSITTGVKNVGIGWYAMHYAEEGNYNTTLGYNSLINNINGGGNIAIGSQAGEFEIGTDLLSHATNCVYIGKGSRAGADSTENEVVIGGDGVTGHGTNTVTIGNTSTTANYFTGSLNATTNSNIPFPYGSWYSDTDQTINNTATTFPITFNNQYYESGITKATDSTFEVTNAGAYLITYSIIAQSSAPNKLLNVWLKIDGESVSASNTITKFVGTNQQRVITVTYVEVLTAGQTIQLQCWSDDTSMILEATDAQNTPDRPLCPSVILTINKVSN